MLIIKHIFVPDCTSNSSNQENVHTVMLFPGVQLCLINWFVSLLCNIHS